MIGRSGRRKQFVAGKRGWALFLALLVGSASLLAVGTGSGPGTYAETIPQVGTIRLAGADRYQTAYRVAEELLRERPEDFFSTVVIASGRDFPDALSGGSLAAARDAPLLLITPEREAELIRFLEARLQKGGTVYLLGGSGAVREELADKLRESGWSVLRLGGADRFATNLRILQELPGAPTELLVSCGYAFADALAGGATGRPLLLVRETLSDQQEAYLAATSYTGFIILGGPASVSPALARQLARYGPVERLGGRDRYETAAAIADRFLPAAARVVLADGRQYADGLAGGPLAFRQQAPLLLTAPERSAPAARYASGKELEQVFLLGGEGALAAAEARAILSAAAPDTPEPADQTEAESPGTPEGSETHHTHRWRRVREERLEVHVVCQVCGFDFTDHARRHGFAEDPEKRAEYRRQHMSGHMQAGEGSGYGSREVLVPGPEYEICTVCGAVR
ncbi:MAG: cell wall-binding repeat-containing protein [Clostridia bacterium]|nr:cell wall-binding repeat-containing protein [Clostridia bacterium]